MRLGKRLYSLVMFLVVSVLGGLLIAGLVVPAAGVSAEVSKSTAAAMDALPAELVEVPLAQKSKVLLADGSTLVNFYDENRQYVTLDKIAPIMQKAQIAIEDHRFYEHGAMDLQGTLRALVSTVRGNTQGASTLTQQYVKMSLISAAQARGDSDGVQKAQENTITRKIQELRYAIALEKQLTKDQILERYLNIAYYGDGAYGVEAAALNYFGVHASKLTLPQAALLAGMVRNPVGTNPRTSGLALVAKQRRNDVRQNLAHLLRVVLFKRVQPARIAVRVPDQVHLQHVGVASAASRHRRRRRQQHAPNNKKTNTHRLSTLLAIRPATSAAPRPAVSSEPPTSAAPTSRWLVSARSHSPRNALALRSTADGAPPASDGSLSRLSSVTFALANSPSLYCAIAS